MQDELKSSYIKDKPLLRDVSGVILAGGKSSRFGQNKAFAKIEGIPIIERVARVFKILFRDIAIISNNPEDYKYLGFPILQDLVRDLGPLGGIFTALNEMPGRYFFVAACDMPFLNERLIRYMASFRTDFDIIAPKMGWKIEALHAFYSTNCRPHIKDLIESGRYHVFRLLQMVSVRYMEEDEIRLYDPELKSLMNINRPQDFMDIS